MAGASERLGRDDGIRVPHSKVLGTIDAGGTRLTELARRAGVVPSAIAELVDDLAAKGYVERVPDPTDGRAKLIQLTERGWEGVRTARAVVEDIERDYGARVGQRRFEDACAVLQELLDDLEREAAQAPAAGGQEPSPTRSA